MFAKQKGGVGASTLAREVGVVAAAEGKRVVLDVTNVDYIDSAGLGALVSVYMHARRTKCALEIANPKQRIRDLFNRSGLASVFEGRSFDVLWEAWSNR